MKIFYLIQRKNLGFWKKFSLYRTISHAIISISCLVVALLLQPAYARGGSKSMVDIFGYPVGQSYQYIRPHTAVRQLVNFRGSQGGVKLRKETFQVFLLIKRQAAKQGIRLSPRAGYRSMAAQKSLYKKYGAKRAEKPGYSEHHLGTAVDFTRIKFQSKAFLWLLKDGIKAGWVPTYYYRRGSRFMREPWHWRYVGRLAAMKFYQSWQIPIERDKRLLEGLKRKGRLAG